MDLPQPGLFLGLLCLTSMSLLWLQMVSRAPLVGVAVVLAGTVIEASGAVMPSLQIGATSLHWGQRRGHSRPYATTWAVGDQVWNTAPAAGGAAGWVCTTAGTPGTRKAMASLAA